MKTFFASAALLALAVAPSTVAGDASSDKKNRCMEELGCFPITKDFYHPIWRALNAQVDPREVIKTTFSFHTKENVDNPDIVIGYNLKGDVINKIHFNPKLETKVVIGGFLDTTFIGGWMTPLTKEFLQMGDYNVILVDWRGGNSLPYTQATANCRVVGAEISVLMKKLIARFNVTAGSFHLYGHSLGSQIAGYAGAAFNGTVARITALDPAQPYFENMPPSVRLDPTDAKFVEAIHTGARSFATSFGFGYIGQVGHLDFFPNGGRVMPGCELLDRFILGPERGLQRGIKMTICNHFMVTMYVRDQLRSKTSCVPVAFDCPSYELFEEGHCYDCGVDGSKCAPVGYKSMSYYQKFANASRATKMYFKTTKRAPFCLFEYNVQLRMRRFSAKNPSEVAKAVSGVFEITIHGSKASEKFTLNASSYNTLLPGSITKALITTPTDLGDILRVTMHYAAKNFFSSPAMELESVKITPMNMAVKRSQLQVYTKTVCPANPVHSLRNEEMTEKNCNRV